MIRPGYPADISFMYATWLKSYRTGSGLGLLSGKHVYFLTYNLILDQILSRPRTKVLVAVNNEDSHVIYGYLVYEPGILHYVFVKEAFRRFGIARHLYGHAFKERPHITHLTELGRDVICTHPGFKFNPSLIFNDEKGDYDHGKERNPRFSN